MVFVDSFDIRGRVNKMAVYSLPDPEHATVGKPADPPAAPEPPAERAGRAGARSGLDLVVVLEPVAVLDAELLRRVADALLWQLVLGGLRHDVAVALGRVGALLGIAVAGEVGLVLRRPARRPRARRSRGRASPARAPPAPRGRPRPDRLRAAASAPGGRESLRRGRPSTDSLTRRHALDFPARAADRRAHGAIAQLGERLDRTQEVGGSSPP